MSQAGSAMGARPLAAPWTCPAAATPAAGTTGAGADCKLLTWLLVNYGLLL